MSAGNREPTGPVMFAALVGVALMPNSTGENDCMGMAHSVTLGGDYPFLFRLEAFPPGNG